METEINTLDSNLFKHLNNDWSRVWQPIQRRRPERDGSVSFAVREEHRVRPKEVFTSKISGMQISRSRPSVLATDRQSTRRTQ